MGGDSLLDTMAAAIETGPTPRAGADHLQRSFGASRLSVRQKNGRSRIATLRQEGIAKIRFPKPGSEGTDAVEAVLLNTAGGLTGGDTLRVALEAQPGARLIAATQACEKIYRSIGGTARVETRIAIAGDARVDWLPQETILFDRSDLSRSLTVDLETGARFFGLEPLVFGRTAMNEQVTTGRLLDRLEVRRGGRPVFLDIGRLEGGIADALDRPAVAAGSRATAAALYAGPDAEAVRDAWRRLDMPGLSAGCSVRDGLVHCRLLAADGLTLRRALLGVIEIATCRPAPPVWRI